MVNILKERDLFLASAILQWAGSDWGEHGISFDEERSEFYSHDLNLVWNGWLAARSSAAPVEPSDGLPELVVSAANRNPQTGVIYPCVRHGCEIFWGLIDDKYHDPEFDTNHFEQGFVTNRYRFVDRMTAYRIAHENGQIRRNSPTPKDVLYSEMLY